MKKFLLGLIMAIVIGGTGAYVYLQGAEAVKPGIENYAVKGTDVFVYAKTPDKFQDLTAKYNEAAAKYMEKTGTDMQGNLQKTLEKYQELQKYVKEIAVVHVKETNIKIEEMEKVEDLELFIIVNAGTNYDLAKPFLTEAFDKTEKGNYILKDDVKEEILESIGQESIDGDYNIYMMMSDRYFVFGFDEDKMAAYTKKVQDNSRATDLIKRFQTLKDDIFEVYAVVDATAYKDVIAQALPANEYITEFEKMEMYTTLKNGEYKFITDIKGKGKLFSMIDSSKISKRELSPYISYNNIYFSNNNLSQLIVDINSMAAMRMGMDYGAMVQMFTGHTLKEFADTFGNEILIGAESASKVKAAVAFKDTAMIEEILGKSGMVKENDTYNMGMDTLTVKDSKIFYNMAGDKSADKISVPNETFLFLPVELGKLLEMWPEQELDQWLSILGENLVVDKAELKENLAGVEYIIACKANGEKIGMEVLMEEQDIEKLAKYMTKVLNDSSK